MHEELLSQIEKSRNEMNRMAKKRHLSSDDILEKSRELDRLLNLYRKNAPF